MTYIADLEDYDYTATEETLLAVGWLDSSHEFTRGTVEPPVVERLKTLAAHHAVNRTRGLHRCGLCGTDGEATAGRRRPAIEVESDGKPVTLGGAEIWLEGPDGVQYAAPDLIIHYIIEHGYRPPEEFLDAAVNGRPALR